MASSSPRGATYGLRAVLVQMVKSMVQRSEVTRLRFRVRKWRSAVLNLRFSDSKSRVLSSAV